MNKIYIALFIVVVVLIVGFYSALDLDNQEDKIYVKKDYGDFRFRYENNVNDSLSFASFINTHFDNNSFVSLPNNEKEPKSIQLGSPIYPQFVQFFSKCNTVNRWNANNIISKTEAINDVIKFYEYLYQGRVKLSEDFDSYLFVEVSKCFYPIVSQFLIVNIKEDKITCVVSIFSYFLFDGHEIYTHIANERNYYRYVYRSTVSDIEGANVNEYIDFIFDSNGCIQVDDRGWKGLNN